MNDRLLEQSLIAKLIGEDQREPHQDAHALSLVRRVDGVDEPGIERVCVLKARGQVEIAQDAASKGCRTARATAPSMRRTSKRRLRMQTCWSGRNSTTEPGLRS